MFCYKCGKELVDGALFCSWCGCKALEVSAQSNSDITSSEFLMANEDEKVFETATTKSKIESEDQECKIISLLNKHLKTIVDSEKQLLISPQDDQTINAFSPDILQRYTSNKPLLVFNYMNDGMKDGFVITSTEFISIYGNRKNAFLLKDLEFANLFKAGLATVMTIFTFRDGRTDKLCTPDIYLTSILDTKKFLSGINSFLLELNRKDIYDEREKKIESKDIKTILTSAFTNYKGDYTYCSIGLPITQKHPKYSSAIANFNISFGTEIYMIYDETILGTCKKGFVVCNQGIYYKQRNNVGYISWNDFKDLRLSPGLTLRIGNLEFATMKKDCNIACSSLSELQSMLK